MKTSREIKAELKKQGFDIKGIKIKVESFYEFISELGNKRRNRKCLSERKKAPQKRGGKINNLKRGKK